MKIGMVYLGVVLIWSTTPLAIRWSNSSLSFISAVTLRMVIALAICALLMALLRRPLIVSRADWKAFVAGALGLFPNMLLVYWSSQYISSGLVAILFGFYPFFVGLFSLLILKQNIFSVSRILALVIAVIGLYLIQAEQIAAGEKALYGIVGMLVANIFFALSSVWLKAINSPATPLRQLTGVLTIATPCFLLAWLCFDGNLDVDWSLRSLIGVSYLAVAGSLFGGMAFYYVLRHCSVASVSLITLITPVAAVALAYVIEHETLGLITLMGCGCILLSLALYQGFIKLIVIKLRTAFFRRPKIAALNISS